MDNLPVQASSSLSLQDMASKLEDMKGKLNLIKTFFKEVMDKDVDYGTISGTDKPTLYQPGADKLCNLYNYAKLIAGKQEHKDYETGHYDVTVKVQLVHRGTQVIAGEGEGCCSTYESKYRYRWVYERDVPAGIDKSTLEKKEYTNRQNGSKFYKYRMENEDLFSQWNTVLKMAIKRGYVAAALSATGLSGLFSQEEDDFDAWLGGTGQNDDGKSKGSPGKTSGSGQQRRGQGRKGSEQPSKLEQQIKAMYSIGEKRGLFPDEVQDLAQQRYQKEITGLTSDEAGELITFLQKAEVEELQEMLGKRDPDTEDDVNGVQSNLFGDQT